MRFLRCLLVPAVVLACKGGDEGEDFPDCATEAESELVDELELNEVGIEAYRYDTMGAVQYVVYIHGDDAGTTQMTITFDGTPVVGMPYEASDVMGTPDVPVVLLLPDNETTPELVSGTIEFTDLGMEDGELLGLEIRLQFDGAVFEGCVKHPISTFGGTGGSDTGTGGADSSSTG
ncbi:MAG TPA: hypothetical protein VFG69_06875 [Nannocystaceae bacterium]|nr:hypothetical protein [Nannocystaceae bacterium]